MGEGEGGREVDEGRGGDGRREMMEREEWIKEGNEGSRQREIT